LTVGPSDHGKYRFGQTHHGGWPGAQHNATRCRRTRRQCYRRKALPQTHLGIGNGRRTGANRTARARWPNRASRCDWAPGRNRACRDQGGYRCNGTARPNRCHGPNTGPSMVWYKPSILYRHRLGRLCQSQGGNWCHRGNRCNWPSGRHRPNWTARSGRAERGIWPNR
jgi:hypothetical protein